MLPAISQVCTLHATLQRDLEDYAAGACRTIELWLGKVDAYLADHSIDELRSLLAELKLSAPVASFQGGLLSSQGDARREHWSLFDRRLELCRNLGVQTLVVAADVAGPLTSEDLQRVQVSLVQAAQRAADQGIRLALEFQARATFCNNLQTAAALVEQTGSPQLGLCLDAFHFFTGSSKESDLGYLTPDTLFHVQVCDLLDMPRELAADSDRILPGDGDFPLAALVTHLQAIGYRGCVSLELMNPQIWQIPPRNVSEIGMTALRKLLGQAEMGASAAVPD